MPNRNKITIKTPLTIKDAEINPVRRAVTKNTSVTIPIIIVTPSIKDAREKIPSNKTLYNGTVNIVCLFGKCLISFSSITR